MQAARSGTRRISRGRSKRYRGVLKTCPDGRCNRIRMTRAWHSPPPVSHLSCWYKDSTPHRRVKCERHIPRSTEPKNAGGTDFRPLLARYSHATHHGRLLVRRSRARQTGYAWLFDRTETKAGNWRQPYFANSTQMHSLSFRTYSRLFANAGMHHTTSRPNAVLLGAIRCARSISS